MEAGHPPGAHLNSQLLFEHQGGAQITSPAHEQLIRAALQKPDGRAHLPQVPKSGQRFNEISQTQGLVYHRGHRVDPRPAEQEGGAHVLVKPRVRKVRGRGAERVCKAAGLVHQRQHSCEAATTTNLHLLASDFQESVAWIQSRKLIGCQRRCLSVTRPIEPVACQRARFSSSGSNMENSEPQLKCTSSLV